MVRRAFDEELFGEDEYGEEDTDGSYHIEQMRITRKVEEPLALTITAVVTEGISSITIARDDNYRDPFHFFIETMDPEPVVNFLEDKFIAGAYFAVMNYLKTCPKVIRDPIEMRMKLDTLLIGGSINSGAQD